MSYILDALKKSEQDRGNGSIPNVQTIHSSALNYHQEKRPLWPWVLIAVLVINVFILIYFLNQEKNMSNVGPAPESKTNNVAPYQDSNPIEKNPPPASIGTIAPVSQQHNSAPISITDNNTNTTKPTPQTNHKIVVDIDELPANIRQQIPNMVFSAHVYSSSPIQRSLVINDRFMEEGSAVGQDLILVEITRSGAIFDFHNYRFRASILSGWSTQ